MAFDPALDLMVDGAQTEIGFERSKDRLQVCEGTVKLTGLGESWAVGQVCQAAMAAPATSAQVWNAWARLRR